MFNHILIPVAPSHAEEYEKAQKAAKLLLGPNGKVSVLSVLEEIPPYVGAHIPVGQVERNTQEVLADLDKVFGDTAETNVIEGHSAQTILNWAKDHGVDCIIVSSHRPGFSDFFIGSTAARVVRHAQCNVVVLR